MKLGFIGTGNMAQALIKGVGFNPESIYISNKTQSKAQEFAKNHSLNFCESNIDVCKNSKIIFICVKPVHFKEVLEEITPYLDDKILISIAAGITIDFLKEHTQNKCKVVRTMPNTPSQVLCGMTGISFDDKTTGAEQVFILELFKRFGEAVAVAEKDMHTVVALSGSSPAYAYMFVNAMAKAGENLGLDYDKSVLLSAQAIMGACKMILETDTPIETLKQNVCSKGGTTIEGVAVLENDIDTLMQKTVEAVYKKSEFLANS